MNEPIHPDNIYLDNNATTQQYPEVTEAMGQCARDDFGNPSSIHMLGQRARHRVETAREQVATMMGAAPKNVVFTSGGTESINLAIRGTLASRKGPQHLITSAVEHSATGKVCTHLRQQGHVVDEVGVDNGGRLDLDGLRAAIRDDTALVSLLWANHETGVLFDVEQIAEICADRGVALHLDAVQAVGKVPVDVSLAIDTGEIPIHFLSIAAHKFHGPKGVGALYVAPKIRIEPLMMGGNQEIGRRGGTENVPGIVGMGVAADIISQRDERACHRMARLRDRLEAGLLETVRGASINGHPASRVCNTLNISFDGLEAEAMLILMSENGIYASSGSACTSGAMEASPILQAMGLTEGRLSGAIRFSLSVFTTEAEIDRVLQIIPPLFSRLKQ